MVLAAVHCPVGAQLEAVCLPGNTRDGRQRYRCMACWRTHATFRRLLALLTEAGWVVAQWLTDAWGAYAAWLPATRHPVDKTPMQRLERKHRPLRTRLKRLARRTSCFSKKQHFKDGLSTLFKGLA